MKFLMKIITLSFLIIAIFGFSPRQTEATIGQTPFGGFSILVINCNCSHNYLIYHLPAAGPSPIIYQPGVSMLYDFRKIKDAGVWLLGNVSVKVPCIKRIGDDCIHLGDFPMITIVGTSDPAHQSHSNLPSTPAADGPTSGANRQSDSRPGYQDDSNNSNDNNNNNNNNQRPTGPGSETPAEGGKTEAETRADLEANGVSVAPDLSPTLSPVSKLPNNAIAGVEDLAEDCGPDCNVMITSGARQEGNPVAPGAHGTGKPVFDLNKDPGLDNYIESNASQRYSDNTGTHYIMPNGDDYLDENYRNTGGTGSHWHVRINADHTTQQA